MSWYAIYTQAGKENIAAQNLGNQDFEVYLPLCKQAKRHARKTVITKAPLFPRYLFVRANPDHRRWRSVNGTIGVSYMVTMGGDPACLDDWIVDQIRARENNDGLVELLPPDFEKGQELRVTQGPFQNLRVLFDRTEAAKRVVVLLTLMGRELEVALRPDHVATS